MLKLIAKYKLNPSIENAKRIVDHNWKHPMASLMLTDEERQILAQAKERCKA